MPPLEGPRATLCVTRKPSKTRTEPSSMRVGMETMSAFLHSIKTFNMFSLMSTRSATRRSCPRAISHGSSLRCEVGASRVVTKPPFALLTDSENRFGGGRRLAVASIDGLRAQPEDIDPWVEHAALGV